MPPQIAPYQSRYFVFTIHYVTAPDAEVLAAQDVMISTFEPGVYGEGQLERCPTTGRTHLQAFCVFKEKKTLCGAKKVSALWFHPYKDVTHWEVMKGTVAESVQYCSKPDTAIEGTHRVWGTPIEDTPGARNDIIAAWDAFRVGGVRAVINDHPSMWLRYSTGFIRALAHMSPPSPMPSPTTWREWQTALLKELEGKPDARKIIWYYDQSGAAGKSTVVRYVCTNSKGIMLEGKVADLAYAYNGEPVVFFDVARTQAEHMDHLYSFAEKLKNGMVSSSKYESRTKYFDPPHVIFMANSLPDYTKWSSDRYDVRTLNPLEF